MMRFRTVRMNFVNFHQNEILLELNHNYNPNTNGNVYLLALVSLAGFETSANMIVAEERRLRAATDLCICR